MRRLGDNGLFAGVREVVDQALGVDDFTTKTAAHKLTKYGVSLGTATLVQDLFNRLDSNWDLTRPTASPPSLKNFRWHEPQLCISKGNPSAEVTLERALMSALGAAGRTDWSNQVPLISGIAGPHAFKRRAIDLVWRQGQSCFEFVELKIKSDTPVFAAIEILVYGLLWLLSRRDRKVLDYTANPILDARELRLSVLAPRDYYSRYSIRPLAITINDGLRKLGPQHGVAMEFRFTAFPASFTWSRDPTDPSKPSGNDLIALLDGRETV